MGTWDVSPIRLETGRDEPGVFRPFEGEDGRIRTSIRLYAGLVIVKQAGMPDPSRLRDSTQIVLPCDALAPVQSAVETEFTVTVFRENGADCRIIGSPVEIKAVSNFLSRRGVSLP